MLCILGEKILGKATKRVNEITLLLTRKYSGFARRLLPLPVSSGMSEEARLCRVWSGKEAAIVMAVPTTVLTRGLSKLQARIWLPIFATSGALWLCKHLVPYS